MSYTFDRFTEETFYDRENEVYRWKSNNAVPPQDVLEEVGLDNETIVKSNDIRSAEQAAFVAEYIREQERFWNDEEFASERQERMSEMRSAFGKGTNVTNIFTGRTISV